MESQSMEKRTLAIVSFRVLVIMGEMIARIGVIIEEVIASTSIYCTEYYNIDLNFSIDRSESRNLSFLKLSLRIDDH